MATTITITYKAFSNPELLNRPVTSLSFIMDLSHDELVADETLCDTIFHDTNVYDGYLWRNFIEPALPENRTHTALSVGDEITIANYNPQLEQYVTRTYRCDHVGWKQLATINY